MNGKEDILDGLALFAGMAADERDALLQCLGARIVSRDKGAVVFRDASRADRFGVVLAGSLVVVREDANGRRTIVKRIGAGELVAAAQAFSATRTFGVRVEADAPSRVLVMNAQRVVAPCERACAFHIKLVRNLMRIFAEKTLELNAKIALLSRRSTADRLLAYLEGVAAKTGSREFDIPFDRQQLANFLCVERSALSAEISRLSRTGILSARKNHFLLKQSPPRL